MKGLVSMITFARGREEGEWNLRSDRKLTVGEQVDVTTKAGGTKTATPTRELWTGNDRDGNPCWLYSTRKDSNSSERPKSSPALTVCPHCGQRLDVAPVPKEAQDDLPF